MANNLKQTIGVGTVANDGLGDPIRTGGQKSNTNFTTLFRGNKVIISLQTSLDDFITNEFDTNETFTVETGTIIEITNASSEKLYYLKYQNTGSSASDYVNINSVGQFVHLIGNETIEGNKRFENFITQNFTDIASVQDIPDISGIRNTLKITGNTNVQTMNPGTLPQGTFVYIYANEAFTIEHLANGSPNEFSFASGQDFTFAANEIALFCLGGGQIWIEISMNSVKGKWSDDGTYLTIRNPRIAKFSKRVEYYQGADIASAKNLTLGEDGNYFKINTITNQIQLIESYKWQKGSHIALELATGARVKHLATASSTFYPICLASGTDFQTTQKTVLELYLNEDNIWIEANGTSLVAGLKTDYIDFDVNITNFGTQNTGITLTFSSGTNQIDWGDGSTIETFTSNVEKVHNYTSNSTYKVRIISNNFSGVSKIQADNSQITVFDFRNIKFSNLTFYIYENSTLTKINNINQNTDFYDFRAYSCGLIGVLDFNNSKITYVCRVHINPNLTEIKNINSNSTIYQLYAYSCDLTGTLDLNNVIVLSGGQIEIYSNSNLKYITGLNKNSNFNNLEAYSCGLTGTLDLNYIKVTTLSVCSNLNLTNVINFNSEGNYSFSAYSCGLVSLDLNGAKILNIRVENNSNLTSITNFSSLSVITDFYANNCNLTGSLDLNNVKITNVFRVHINPNLTGIININSTSQFYQIYAYSCNLTGTLDLNNAVINTGELIIYNNPLLTAIINIGIASIFNSFDLKSNALGIINIDSITANNNNKSFYLQNNTMSAAEVNENLVDFVATGWTATTATINLAGTNYAPDGTSGGFDGLTAKANLISRGWTVITN